jgi:hypothetical protein
LNSLKSIIFTIYIFRTKNYIQIRIEYYNWSSI